MKGLSKSNYTAFCQCPKNLWLKVYKPNEATVDSGLQARFDTGHKVGELAKKYFGSFVDVTTTKADGTLDYAAMIEKTKEEMARGTENICEAAFSYLLQGKMPNYCAVDILHKTPDGWAIYEVKSTSFPMFNEKRTKLGKYAPDIAYQKWVLEQCGINVTGTYLVCLNSDYVLQGHLDIQKLFIVKDMQNLVDKEYDKVEPRVHQAMQVLSNNVQDPGDDLSERCNKPYHCAFWNYCAKEHNLPSPSVFDVYGGNRSKKEDRFYMDKKLALYRQGKTSFADIQNEPLGHIQRLQVDGRESIDIKGIRDFLGKLTYPLYFLDFETMQPAIPMFEGTKPYQQIPFQYSLHIKKNANVKETPQAFLAESDGSDPRRALAEQLCNDIPKGVCTLAFNKKFECDRLNELAEAFPYLSDHLLDISNNIIDLIEPFQAGYYYEPAMGGSFSIKSVLPALFPNDPSLNYHNLDIRVQNGGDAMNIYPKIKDMDPIEAKATRQALLKYCELDTLAMVRIWEKLREMANTAMP